MTSSNVKVLPRVDKRSIAAVGAGVLIGLGLVLQWIEVLASRYLTKDAWFVATVLSESWSVIKLLFSTAPWRQELFYWPLLLVITGAALLFSHCQKARSQ